MCPSAALYAEELPTLSMTEMTKVLGDMWKQASDEEKAPFMVGLYLPQVMCGV
jgi:hypothetical protein